MDRGAEEDPRQRKVEVAGGRHAEDGGRRKVEKKPWTDEQKTLGGGRKKLLSADEQKTLGRRR